MAQIHSKNYSFHFLNATQFLGALNDNVFKLIIIYLLINTKGADYAPSILAIAGAIFVIPFLLFSSAAGILADRISKRSILVGMKVAEVVIMFLSIFAIHFHSEIFCYIFLFFMATQSTLFGPSKYGIIPELVAEEAVSKANGILTSLTFLAVILGTFFATFITDITNKNFFIGALSCFVIAILGFLTSLKIIPTEAQRSTRKIKPFFLYEIYQTLALSYKRLHLLPAILGSAFFLFVGAFIQLNIIPFAMQSLHLSEVGGGYLFLATAIGIALGSLIAGKISKDKVQPGLACICGFFLALLLFLLYLFAFSIIAVIMILILLGLFGGMFLIPFDSFIQVASPDARRGQIIAASNFLSFSGVLLASLCLYVNSDVLHFTSSTGFALMGLFTLIFSLITAGRMSDLFFPYLTQKLFLKIFPYRLSALPDVNSLIILRKGSWKDALMLFALLPKLKIITLRKKLFSFPFKNGLILSFGLISKFKHAQDSNLWLLKLANQMKKRNDYVCIFSDEINTQEEWKTLFSKIRGNKFNDAIFIHIEKEKISKSFVGINIPLKESTIYFTDDYLPQKIKKNTLLS